jgi:hypothetical protein
MTPDPRPGFHLPAGVGQVLSDRLGDLGAIVFVELLAQTTDQAQAFHEAISDRKA